MNATGSLFSQVLSLFQRSDFARHARELKAEFRAKVFRREMIGFDRIPTEFRNFIGSLYPA